jgi:hypothetical protein
MYILNCVWIVIDWWVNHLNLYTILLIKIDHFCSGLRGLIGDNGPIGIQGRHGFLGKIGIPVLLN